MAVNSDCNKSVPGLVTLPTEIRAAIYEYYLEGSYAQYSRRRDPVWGATGSLYVLKSSSHRNLLLVCKQLYFELYQSYYSKTLLWLKYDWWHYVDPRPYINVHFQRSTQSLAISSDGPFYARVVGLFQELRTLQIPSVHDSLRVAWSGARTVNDAFLWDRLEIRDELQKTLETLLAYRWVTVIGRYEVVFYGSSEPPGRVRYELQS